MLSKITVLAFAILFFNVGEKSKPLNPLDDAANVIGKPASIKVSKYKVILKNGVPNKGQQDSKIIYTFDDAGHLIRKENFNGDSQQVFSYLVVKTDNNGLIYECTSFFGENFISRRNRYFYDFKKKQILIESVHPKSNTLLEKIIETFDDNNNIVMTANYGKNDSLYSNTVSRFDARNNVVEETVYRYNEPWGRYRYSYRDFDASGNWIQRVEYIEDKAVWMVIREIKLASK